MSAPNRLPDSPIGVLKGSGSEIEEADDAFLRMVGYTRADFEAGQMSWQAMTPPEFLHLDEAGIRQAMDASSGGFTAPYQKEFFRKDGTRVPVLLVCAFIPGTVGRWLGYVVDLSTGPTPRTSMASDGDVPLTAPLPEDFYGRLVSELVRERSRMIAMLDNTDALVWAVDLEWRLLAGNAAFQAAQRLVSGHEIAIGESVLDPGYSSPLVAKLVEEWTVLYSRAAKGERLAVTTQLELPGRTFSFQSVLTPIVDATQSTTGVAVVSQDLTARREIEHALRESEARFRSLANSAPLGIYLTDLDARPIYVNPRVAEMWGTTEEDAAGPGNWLRNIHPEDAPRIARESQEARRQGREFVMEFRLCLPEGERHMRVRVAPVRDGDRITGWVGNVEDETERRAQATRERQRERMESLGTLAGGIAHDFNNMLGIILGYVELARGDLGASDVDASLGEIQTAAERARDLVQQILAFSRQAEHADAPVDLGHLVLEATRLLRATLPAPIQLDLRVAPGPIIVRGNAATLQQIVVNLCTNAAHAMRGQPGKLVVQLAASGAPPDGEALLTVTDSGCGMTSAVQGRIFEPFFTTKPVGEGTGMGLAVVHGVVNAHGGTISVESAVGAGSTFRVALPLVSAATVQQPAASVASPPLGGRVLFVEDETALANLAAEVLTRAGFHTTVAADGLEALRVFSADPDRFDLVVSDLAMPHLSGDRLAQAIHLVRPRLPFVLVSGFLGALDDPKELGVTSVLGKPLTNDLLVRAVQRALAEPPPLRTASERDGTR